MINCIAFTDIHGEVAYTRQIVQKAVKNKAEFLICAGDISEFGITYKECLKVLKQANLPIYFVGGNHDVGIMVELTYCYPWLRDLSGKIVAYKDIDLIGIPEEDFTTRWEVIEQKDWWLKVQSFLAHRDHSRRLVIVSHYPPESSGFQATTSGGGPSVPSELLDICRPDLFVCGHHHHHFGKQENIAGQGILINPGPTGALMRL